ncbi:NAD(P)/FAD-dependent oxidoreductase [Mesorhizobium sp.]|uniref:flavin-containing monooxygenase n=1 Tax=Mesorhizobium sp. TaxID=1871066 RepID=UPI00338DBD48
MAAAYALSKAGLGVLLLEKEHQVGEPWRRRHDDLHLNSHRIFSSLPGVNYSEGTPAFPHKSAVVDHLNLFVRHHALAIEYDIHAGEVSFAGGHWVIQTNAGTRTARHVVIATGRDRVPYIPQWNGMENFSGEIIHSAAFGDAKTYSQRKVLVVGAGNSGFDVLNHLAKVDTAHVWLSARNGPTLLPKRMFRVAVHLLSPLIARLPTKAADAAMAATQRLAFGDLTKIGLPPAAAGGVSRLISQNTAIATDDGAVEAMKAGKVIVLPEVREFTPRGVILANGNLIGPDIVVAATGYRTGLEPMVGKLGVLDGKGVPLFNGGDHDPTLPGLWFTGMAKCPRLLCQRQDAGHPAGDDGPSSRRHRQGGRTSAQGDVRNGGRSSRRVEKGVQRLRTEEREGVALTVTAFLA